MKTNKKFLSTLLAFSMILTMVQPAFAYTISGTNGNNSYKSIGMNIYSRQLDLSDNGYVAVQDWDNLWGLTDVNGNMSVPYEYSELVYLNHDYFKAVNGDDQLSVISSDGSLVYQPHSDVKDISYLGDYIWLTERVFATPSSLNSVKNSYYSSYFTFLDRNFQEVTVEEVFDSFTVENRSLGNFNTTTLTVDGQNYSGISDASGTILIEHSSTISGLRDINWNDTYSRITRINSYKEAYCDYSLNIMPFHRTWNDEGTTVFIDYVEGVVYGEIEGYASNINEDGYYICEYTDGSMRIAHTDDAYWLTGEELPEQIHYELLPNAVAHTSYLTAVYDIDRSSTLVSGSFPKGVGLYEDGIIGGVPMESGQFDFVVETVNGYACYSLTVDEPTADLVEKDNDFEIIERVPTIDSNENNYVFEVSGEFSDFLNVYIDGQLLADGVHYMASEGSTKITIAAQTISQLDSGSHTINATFGTTNVTVTPVTSASGSTSSGSVTTNSTSKSANVASVAQVFNKTVEPAPMMAMPFSDVAVSDWHYQYVRYMYDTGTFSGVTNTTYEPNTGMTRAMMAVVFYGMAGKPSTGSAGFSDIVDGEWYADAVNWISTSGIDDSTGNFRPTDLITREETAKMMHNFCTDQGIFIPLTTSRTPSDMNSVSENAKNAVNVLFSKGIFAGDDANNFNPHNTSTRAEISAMMRTFMWATV